jgi:hypothetical protein
MSTDNIDPNKNPTGELKDSELNQVSGGWSVPGVSTSTTGSSTKLNSGDHFPEAILHCR